MVGGVENGSNFGDGPAQGPFHALSQGGRGHPATLAATSHPQEHLVLLHPHQIDPAAVGSHRRIDLVGEHPLHPVPDFVRWRKPVEDGGIHRRSTASENLPDAPADFASERHPVFLMLGLNGDDFLLDENPLHHWQLEKGLGHR